MRLQSQQMLDQIHGDEPLQTSGTGPVDGDNDSSESEADPGLVENNVLSSDKRELGFARHGRERYLNKPDPVQNGILEFCGHFDTFCKINYLF